MLLSVRFSEQQLFMLLSVNVSVNNLMLLSDNCFSDVETC